MAQIKIEKNIKFDDIESYYDRLYDYISQSVSIDLMLPKELEHQYLGVVPAVYQFAITWVRYSKSGKLLIDIDDPTTTDYEKLYENELVFPLVSLVWNKNEVYNKNGEINLRSKLREHNQRIFEKMKGGKESTLFSETSPEAMKGGSLLLTEFDHLPRFHGTLPCFEINGEFVQNETVFKENILTGIRGVLKFSNNVAETYGDASDDLIGIVYELMKNTFEWAKDDENQVPIDPSLRGLLIKFFKRRRNTFLEDYKDHEGLTNYFKSDLLKENANGEIYCLELSVFDSGIGFVKKFKSLNYIDESSDIDIIKRCLIKHNTSERGLERDDKGLGLDRILTILDKKGFLRIRTGNTCVYRNLISNRYKSVTNDDISEMALFDWNKNSDSDYTKFENAEGSVVTIIYPLST